LTNFILDSYAWIEYLLATEKSAKIQKIFDEKENRVFTHILSLAEISSRLKRGGGEDPQILGRIGSISRLVTIDQMRSIQAGLLHSEMRKKIKDFGLVDAFILLAARDLNAKILTGDPHFKNMKEVIMI